MAQPEFVPLNDRYDPGTTPEDAARAFHQVMSKRRTVREYSDRPVSEETIRWLSQRRPELSEEALRERCVVPDPGAAYAGATRPRRSARSRRRPSRVKPQV